MQQQDESCCRRQLLQGAAAALVLPWLADGALAASLPQEGEVEAVQPAAQLDTVKIRSMTVPAIAKYSTLRLSLLCITSPATVTHHACSCRLQVPPGQAGWLLVYLS